jgi:predicted TIM-barrel fold metal-dependent hydrolase
MLPMLARADDELDPAPRRVDVHHHFFPPPWLAHAETQKPGPAPMMRDWSPARVIEHMDKSGVATAIASLSPWGIAFAETAQLPKLARACNDEAAKMIADHPGRFGLFAAMPLPDIDSTLKEIAYAFDTLKVDGIGLMTNYNNKWLGDDAFAPVFEELNRRKAVVYTHPISPSCCVNVLPGVPDYIVEWGADTTRTIVSLIFTGASMKYPDINFIFSHGGGALTAEAERLRIQILMAPPYKGKFTREMVDHELSRFYYDTAQVANEVTIQALAKLVGLSQIVFGTDYPYRTSAEHVAGLAQRFSTDDLAAIDSGNVLRILPKRG